MDIDDKKTNDVSIVKNLTAINIPGYLENKTVHKATDLLNEEPNGKIYYTYFNTENQTRTYLMANTDTPYIKYVCEENSIKNNPLSTGFCVIGKYYIYNIPAVHQFFVSEEVDLADCILKSNAFEFTKLPYIDYQIVKKTTNKKTIEFDLILKYNRDKELHQLRKELTNVLSHIK